MAGTEPAEAVVTWRDLAAVARRKAVRSWVWALLVPVCLLILALMGLFQGVVPRVLGVMLILYFASSPLWGATTATWLQARRKAWPDHPTTWAVTDAGLAVTNDIGETTLPWTTLSGANAWRRGVSLGYGRAVAFIPARAFRDAEHRAAFVAAVQASMSANSA